MPPLLEGKPKRRRDWFSRFSKGILARIRRKHKADYGDLVRETT